MEYFSIVNLEKEPFSNSPDPDFFYGSHQHLECLQKLELALRLRRGLNVIIGDIGTGKTTLCRQLIRRFAGEDEFETHLILDPDFSSSTEFLCTVIKMLTGKKPPERARDWQMKEVVKHYLFRRGVDENKTVVLIIDEGQKLPVFCLELLREFLNYETNEYKLLQIVIFAQNEFEKTVTEYANFADRINLYHYLKPMSFSDTRSMIRYRLEKSSQSVKRYSFFSLPALLAIFVATRGYPRKIINLCHRCILTMIIQNRTVVDLFLARTCIRRVFPQRNRRSKRLAFTVGIPVLLLAVVLSAANLNLLRLPAGIGAAFTSPRIVEQSLPSYRKIDAGTTGQSPAVEAKPSVASASPPEATAAPTEPPAETISKTEMAIRTEGVQPPKPAGAVNAPDDGGVRTVQEVPSDLGRVTIMRSETIYSLIENVYGAFSSKLFRSLILANPHIEDPDLVMVGQSILVPAVPADVRPPAQQAWWVSIAHRRHLDQAIGIMRSLPATRPPIRLVSYWTPREGTQFDLMLDRYFTNLTAAQQSLGQLPAALAAEGRVVSIWSPEAVFFTNPFFESLNRPRQG